MSAVDRYVERIRRVPPIVVDAALAVAILAYDIIELLPVFAGGDPLPSRWWILFFAVPCLGLVVRRRYIWVPFALVQGYWSIVWALVFLFHVKVGGFGEGSFNILTLVVVYSVADRAPAWAAALVVMAFVFDQYIGNVLGHWPPGLIGTAIYWTPFYLLPAIAGWFQQRRRKVTVQLELRAEDVRREQERLAEQAVARERIQMAHELRALVTRGVELMAEQARTARRLLQGRSMATQDGVAAIEATGRSTLVEMRRLLLVLRRGASDGSGEGAPEAPISDLEIEEGVLEPIDGGTPTFAAWLPSWVRRPWIVDWCLVLLLSGVMAGEFTILTASEHDGTLFAGWFPVVLAPVILSVLLIRRRFPLSVLCVISVAVFLWVLHQGDMPEAAESSLYLAAYTVAAYKNPRWAVAAVAIVLFSGSPLPARYGCLCLVGIGTRATLAAVAGVAMYMAMRLNTQLESQTDLLVRTRGERARLAVAQERTRVARDMHDLVAHSVTAMVVQAGAARMVAETDPALADEHLTQIEETGVDAMRELGILDATLDPASPIREGDRSGDASDLRALVDRFRRTGQAVHLIEEGEPPPVDQGLQISVYRIVQEALTNVQKHARGAPTTVSIRYLQSGIEIEVANSAAPPIEAGALPGAGQGLIGIHERASVFGGRAEAGQTPAGGFRVYVQFPAELVPA